MCPSSNPQKAGSSTSASPLKFFVLAFLLSIPFWIAGAGSRLQLMPGLPIAALGFVCPAIAASILVYRQDKAAGVRDLLARSFDYERIQRKIWYAPIFLLMPILMLLSCVVIRLTGTRIPAPQIAVLPALGLFIIFFISAIGEEIGWSGYATDPLERRWNALGAGVVLGMVWAIWHFVPLMQANRSASWIAWWSLGTVSARVLIVWLYNNTGRSVFAAAFFHATINLTWQLFPIHGSFYDPRITSPITALAAAIVTIVWGPRSLARPSAKPES